MPTSFFSSYVSFTFFFPFFVNWILCCHCATSHFCTAYFSFYSFVRSLLVFPHAQYYLRCILLKPIYNSIGIKSSTPLHSLLESTGKKWLKRRQTHTATAIPPNAEWQMGKRRKKTQNKCTKSERLVCIA